MSKKVAEDPLLKHVRKFSESGIDTEKAIDAFVESVVVKKPQRPTYTAPGSIDRLLALRDRVARGEEVYHPRDGDFMGRRGDSLERVTYSGFNNRRSIRKL